MKLETNTFAHGGAIPQEFTCDGAGINPALSWEDVPARTKSLTLIMDDPDVPKHIKPDGMWDHWVVFNISPTIAGVKAGERILGTYGVNGSGETAYQGPCPPDREHRYFFRLYALDTRLDLPPGATKEEVLKAMEGHTIETAELMGRYERVR